VTDGSSSAAKYAVSARRGRRPDVSIYFPGAKLPRGSAGLGRSPRSIVVEVVSSRPRDARRDRVEKVADYHAFGVPLYWIIEPSVRLFEALDLRGDQPVIVLSAADGVHPAPGCDGLTLDLDALWAEIDQLPKDNDDG
jgi:Uma2 family endonuclease